MSNAAKMTLEEKLVQHIKDVGLGALIDDEDAITELTRKAVQQALITPRKERVNDWSSRDVPAPAVQAAEAIAKRAIEKIVDEEVERLKADPGTMKAVREAMALMWPKVIHDKMNGFYDYAIQNAAIEAGNTLRNAGVIR